LADAGPVIKIAATCMRPLATRSRNTWSAADVTAAARVGLMMQVLMRMATVDSLAIEIRSVEVTNFCLVMVNPDERVIVDTHD